MRRLQKMAFREGLYQNFREKRNRHSAGILPIFRGKPIPKHKPGSIPVSRENETQNQEIQRKLD